MKPYNALKSSLEMLNANMPILDNEWTRRLAELEHERDVYKAEAQKYKGALFSACTNQQNYCPNEQYEVNWPNCRPCEYTQDDTLCWVEFYLMEAEQWNPEEIEKGNKQVADEIEGRKEMDAEDMKKTIKEEI